jgi:hypothetical protein
MIKMKKLISVLLAVSALALSTSAFAASADETFAGKPVFREGDAIEFVVEDATNLTLISSLVDAEKVDNATIQYVDETNNGTISYKVRDLKEGEYQIVINDGKDKATYNYVVADFDLVAPDGGLLVGQNGDSAFYAAFAQVKGADFADVINGVGFKFNDKKTATIAADALDSIGFDFEGAKTVVYGITMNGVVDINAISADTYAE